MLEVSDVLDKLVIPASTTLLEVLELMESGEDIFAYR